MKRAILNVNLKKYPRHIQHSTIDLKLELPLKIVNNFKLLTIFVERSILGVSQVLSSPLTTINQASLRTTKELYHGFFGTLTLTTQPGFYLLKENNRNTKNPRVRREMYLKLTVRTSERRQ